MLEARLVLPPWPPWPRPAPGSRREATLTHSLRLWGPCSRPQGPLPHSPLGGQAQAQRGRLAAGTALGAPARTRQPAALPSEPPLPAPPLPPTPARRPHLPPCMRPWGSDRCSLLHGTTLGGPRGPVAAAPLASLVVPAAQGHRCTGPAMLSSAQTSHGPLLAEGPIHPLIGPHRSAPPGLPCGCVQAADPAPGTRPRLVPH